MSKNRNVPDITPICNKCGKTAPLDENMSNDNWKVYKVKDPCECGGQFMPKCLLLGATETEKGGVKNED